ncbi:hypothetical protein A8C56_10070 [Niabella ginsenosidivorans]|uniref:HTH cro/C1-type domain-containing protein n=1 Tax=Niabella ginsenosidivorans TaxID=1176587 RepID=A0A1A9I0Y5_9BACT|nr:helix-turn-helix transcriptional regulator [Niabella ginsenosidivorans]ANH81286.1 hypothetical protein A8C56_10070 [Niabella ginsenosidivorans]
MSFGKRLGDVRKIKNVSQEDLAKAIGTILVTMGRYERDEVNPSIEVAAKITDTPEVSLGYLTDNTDLSPEKNIVKRMVDIQQQPEDEQAHLLVLMDAFFRDKAKKAYAQQ